MTERLRGGARRTAGALARAVLPAGRVFAAADARTVARLERLLGSFDRLALPGYAALLRMLEVAPMATHRGRTFSRLGVAEAQRFLSTWAAGDFARRVAFQALTAPLKVAHFEDPAVYGRLRCTYEFRNSVQPQPWMQQVRRGADLEEPVIDCDVVVVGTGAGGAVAARELAERGHAVLMLEEGEYYTRADFTGRSLDCVRRFYRFKGRTGAVGNTFIYVPVGRTVGGSTTINTGTCWRTPARVLDHWVRDLGLRDLTGERLAPYFERLERELRVEAADVAHMGGVPRVIARGCAALGYTRHHPLRRNAPECDGSGVCDFGCPTDAKLGMNLTYVPAALKRGAQLVTGVRAERVLTESGRIVGVEARARGSGRTLRVRARATVLACGSFATPLLLRRSGLARGLRHVGRNLSLHPGTTVSALFDEEIRGYAAMPQGYCVDEFHDEGILLLGASAPIDMGAAQFPFIGPKLMEVMEAYDRVCSFGVMVEDGPNGRVLPGPGGMPLVAYWLGRRERQRLLRGVAILARIYLAAGAREVYAALHGHRVIRSEADLACLEAATPSAADFLLVAFHPLGTCRMATSPRAGVVSAEHEVFGRPGLYVMDGSVVPTSLGVNPQVTIMALAARAAERLAARLEGAS